MVHKVTDTEDFQQKLIEAGDKLVVVDFFASWCGPCKYIAPKVEEMAAERTDVVFLKVDVDECDEITVKYNINSMPTFVFIKNCKLLDSFSGANVSKLNELIGKHSEA